MSGLEIRIALAVSVALHAIFLLLLNPIHFESGDPTTIVAVKLNPLVADAAGEGTGIEALQTDNSSQDKAQDKRREIFLQYLEDISAMVHSMRFVTGSRELIGIASYTFYVQPDGKFSNIRLKNSSGKAALDKAAYEAIKASSGKVKRPKAIGLQPIPVLQEVRYQYGLR